MKILNAAVRGFASGGYHGTSIRDISKMCGLHQPTIYHFFQNKDNLFWTALRMVHLKTRREVRKRIDRTGDLKQELLSVFRALVEMHRENPEPPYLMFRLVHTAPPDIRDSYDSRHRGEFQDLVGSAFRRHGGGDDHRLRLIMHLFQSLLFVIATPGFALPEFAEYESLIERIMNES